MPQMDITNKQLHYDITGEGETIVLIHAALLDSRMWNAQAVAFSKYFQVLTYDLYGYGNSTLTEEKRIEHVDDLALLLDNLHIEKAHILGASMGGEIAQRFALEYPERVRSLILIGAGLEGYEYPEDAFAWWATFVDAIHANTLRTAETIFIEHALNRKEALLSAELYTSLQTIMQDYTFKHYVDDTLLWKTYDVPVIEQLGTIICPALIIVGEADTPVNHSIAQFLVNEISNATFITIPNSGHLSNLQHPDLFNQSVINFLNGIKA